MRWWPGGIRGIISSMMMVILASILTVSIVGLVFSGPSWYIILHEDGGDGDVDIVGGLRAFVV